MGLKIKLLSSFFDIVSELLRFDFSRNLRSFALFLGKFGETVVKTTLDVTFTNKKAYKVTVIYIFI